MKKFVAILMAAMLVLASVSALAAKSVNPGDNTNTTSQVFIIVDHGATANDYIAKLNEAENHVTVFAENTQAGIKEKVAETAYAYEVVSLRAPGWDQKSEETLVLDFETGYKAGSKVCAVLVTVTGGAVEENILNADVPQDDRVNVYWPVSMMQKIWDSDESFILIMSEEIDFGEEVQ